MLSGFEIFNFFLSDHLNLKLLLVNYAPYVSRIINQSYIYSLRVE